VTIWNVAFALVLVAWAFGWSGGRQLVEQAYGGAKARVAEQKAKRRTQAPSRSRAP
jgi:hypothetical protein